MPHIRKNIVAMASVALFGLGYAALLFTGVSNIQHLFDNLVAGYLMAWGLYSMLSDLSRVEIGKRFILMTFSLGLCVLLAETVVLFRLVDYREFFGGFDSHHALGTAGRQFDRELLWRHEPHYRFSADYQGNLGRALCVPPDPSHKVEVRYDRNGFRNPE